MSVLAEALVPVFLVIAIGWATKVSGVLKRSAWEGFEQVTYYVLFPALIGGTLAMTDLSTVPLARMGGAMALSVIVMAALLLITRPLMQTYLRIDGPAFCSIFQGSTRWNSFVAIALAADMFGKQGLALAAVASVAMIPLLNIMAVLVHARYASGKPAAPRALAMTLIKNPFIWSTLLGIGWNLLAIPMPKFGAVTLDIVGRAALSAGLLCVGAGLELTRIRHAGLPLVISIVPKLILMPLIATTLAKLFGVTGAAYTVTLIGASVPAASASYLLARQLGGDHAFMAEILSVQTLLAVLTIPAMMLLFGT
ncbi:MAG: AEC family transporter [Beijerinckiaceae bacterium]